MTSTLVLKLGYDRIYRTLLPINIENKLKLERDCKN